MPPQPAMGTLRGETAARRRRGAARRRRAARGCAVSACATFATRRARVQKAIAAIDAENADAMLRLLMGDSAMPRKEFIAANAPDGA